jgi:hypothetical protein
VAVAPYIEDDGVVRRRGVAEFVVAAAVFGSFAAFWRETRLWSLLLVGAILIDDLRFESSLRLVLVLAKELLECASWLLWVLKNQVIFYS